MTSEDAPANDEVIANSDRDPNRSFFRKDKIIAYVGVASTTTGAVAGVFEHIATLKKGVLDVFGSDALLMVQDNMRFVVGACITITFVAICLWIQLNFLHIFEKMMQVSRKALIMILWLSGIVLASGCAYYTVPPAPNLPAELRPEINAFEKELMSLGVSTGGMRYNRADNSADAQVWCTAQAIWGILQKPANEISQEEAQSIRGHLEYMERVRLPKDEGWGYMEPINWGVTEIAAWVTLAYVASVRSDIAKKIWQEEVNIPLRRIETYLKIISKRQASNGGWSPVNSVASYSYLRTYSTVMSIWAMVEAQRIPNLEQRLKIKFSPAIQSGLRWLLTNYNKDRESAVPNPARAQQVDTFPGLTAQILYVMERAKINYEFVLQNDPNYDLNRHHYARYF